MTIPRPNIRRLDAARPREGSAFDAASERFARGLANRMTRRSFLGDVAKGGIALAAGGAFAGVAGVDDAAASHCGGCNSCSGNSITCNCLTGTNDCPANTCECGWWDTSGGPCSSGCTRWIDCCKDCETNRTCRHNCSDNCNRKCCNPKTWCGGCGTQGSTRVHCRKHTCPGGCHDGQNSC
jgi:hypothetical protein